MLQKEKTELICPLCGGELDLVGWCEDMPDIWECNDCKEQFIIEDDGTHIQLPIKEDEDQL